MLVNLIRLSSIQNPPDCTYQNELHKPLSIVFLSLKYKWLFLRLFAQKQLSHEVLTCGRNLTRQCIAPEVQIFVLATNRKSLNVQPDILTLGEHEWILRIAKHETTDKVQLRHVTTSAYLRTRCQTWRNQNGNKYFFFYFVKMLFLLLLLLLMLLWIQRICLKCFASNRKKELIVLRATKNRLKKATKM